MLPSNLYDKTLPEQYVSLLIPLDFSNAHFAYIFSHSYTLKVKTEVKIEEICLLNPHVNLANVELCLGITHQLIQFYGVVTSESLPGSHATQKEIFFRHIFEIISGQIKKLVIPVLKT